MPLVGILHLKEVILNQMAANIEFCWCCDDAEAEQTAQFFVANVSTDYISHTDIQWGRAIAPDCWSTLLHEKIAGLAKEAADHRRTVNTASGIWLATAIQSSVLLGMAFVSFRQGEASKFVILEDLIIKSNMRHQGLGSSLLNWISEECRALGFDKVFLESNIHNIRAHEFFHREGFKTLSVVMCRSL